MANRIPRFNVEMRGNPPNRVAFPTENLHVFDCSVCNLRKMGAAVEIKNKLICDDCVAEISLLLEAEAMAAFPKTFGPTGKQPA